MSDETESPVAGRPDLLEPEAARKRQMLLIIGGIALAAVLVGLLWWFQRGVEVPNVVGLTQDQAVATLETAGLTIGQSSIDPTLAVAPGTVTSQTPSAGSEAAAGTQVDVLVAAVPTVEVPDVSEAPLSEAEQTLAQAGLRTGDVTDVYTDKQPTGVVVGQQPGAFEPVQVGSVVDLEVSAGPKNGAVPDVTGLISVDAVDVLQSAGFAVTESTASNSSVEAGVVISQSPSAGTVAVEGASVAIVVSTGAPASEPAPPTEQPAAAPEPEPAPPATTEPPAEKPEAPKPKPEPEPDMTEVPDVVGMGVLEAFGALRKVKLQIEIEWGPSEDAVLKVIDQDPDAGSQVDDGSSVTVTIGLPAFLFDVEVQPLPAEPPSTPEAPAGSETPSAEPEAPSIEASPAQ